MRKCRAACKPSTVNTAILVFQPQGERLYQTTRSARQCNARAVSNGQGINHFVVINKDELCRTLSLDKNTSFDSDQLNLGKKSCSFRAPRPDCQPGSSPRKRNERRRFVSAHRFPRTQRIFGKNCPHDHLPHVMPLCHFR